MIEAQKFARGFSISVKKQYPFLPPGSVIYFPHQDHRHRQALLDYHATRTLYSDQTLSIYYNKESLVDSLEAGENRPVYVYLPE